MLNTHGYKMEGLKKVAGETKDLRGYYSGMYHQINYNQKTGEVWSDTHVSLGHNSWSEYSDTDIICVGNVYDRTSMQDLANMIAGAIEARVNAGNGLAC